MKIPVYELEAEKEGGYDKYIRVSDLESYLISLRNRGIIAEPCYDRWELAINEILGEVEKL